MLNWTLSQLNVDTSRLRIWPMVKSLFENRFWKITDRAPVTGLVAARMFDIVTVEAPMLAISVTSLEMLGPYTEVAIVEVVVKDVHPVATGWATAFGARVLNPVPTVPDAAAAP